MQYDKNMGAIESILFVSGEPVPLVSIQHALNITELELKMILDGMSEHYVSANCGIKLHITEQTVQLVSNPIYTEAVLALLQPVQEKSFSQSLLETLSIIAYKQPVTRAEIESFRGVRCEYAVTQLIRLGMIHEVGRKEVVGRPALLGTTDAFLHHFGIRSVGELPKYESFSVEDDEQTLVV